MANNCFTDFRFYCANDDIAKSFYERTMKPIETGDDWGRWWLGNTCKEFGIEPETTECRGSITDVHLNGDEVDVYTDTAWTPMIDMWRLIIAKNFLDESGEPLIQISYKAEEFGCDIYVTNDMGTFDWSRYHVEIQSDEYDFWESDYFCDEVGAVQYVNDMLNTSFESITEIRDYDWPENTYVNVHELEEVDW